MKFILAIIIVFLSLNQIYCTTIELTERGYVVGEIKDISEDEIFLSKDDVLIIVSKKVIKNIFEGPDTLRFEDLLSKDYTKLNLEEYEVLRFNEDNLDSEEIAYHIQLKVEDEIVINSEYFIELENGKMILGEFEEKHPIFAKIYFLTSDENRIELEEVKSYKNEDGFFHKVPDPFSTTAFARRIVEGKIDLFSKKVSQSIPMSGAGGFTSFSPGFSFEYDIAFFKKNGEILKANYPNLKIAINDNQNCVEYLNKYKTLNYVQGGLIITGLGMIIGAFTSVDKDEGISDGGKLLAITGGIVINSNWIPYFMKLDIIEDALREYNR